MTDIRTSVPALLFAASAAAVLPSPAFAQSRPADATPGQLPSRDQTTPEQTARPAAEGAMVDVDSRDAIRPSPCPLPDNLSVTIREVRFTAPGGGALPAELADLLTDVTTDPAPQSIKVVCSLRDEAIARLRGARYVASVQIPQQQIADGVLKLEVVSGRVVEMRVRGNPGAYRGLLETRIAQLKSLDPLNEADAERILLLANDVPGLTVQLRLSPAGTRPGDLIGDLNVAFRRTRVVANVQNLNSGPLGRESGYVRADFYGLTGMGDITSIAALASTDFRRQLIGQLSHSMMLDSNGTTLSFNGTLARSRPQIPNLDLRTVSKVVSVEFSAPVQRRLNSNLTSAFGFEFAEQRTKVFSPGRSDPLFRDRIATFYSRLSANARKLDGHVTYRLNSTVEVRKGINAFGANKPGVTTGPGGFAPTRFDGSATASVIRADVTGQIGIGPVFEIWGRGKAQYSNRALLNYDEFAIGNLTIGRGYDPGANTGDRALGGAGELRGNFKLGNNATGQVFTFYDIVRLTNLDANTTEGKRTLHSLGGGVRLTALQSVNLELTYAHPMDPPLLTGTAVKRPSDRVLFSLTAQLVPFIGAR